MSVTQTAQKGEWNVAHNNNGRRYTSDGKTTEYEPTIFIDGIEIPESQRAEYLARRDEALAKMEAERLRRERATQAAKMEKKCPFKLSKNVIDSSCSRECPFFVGASCVLSGTHAAKKGNGFCPVCGKCNPSCAMYSAGCTLPEAIKMMKEHEKT